MKKEVKICMPYYKIAYSIAFVVILSAIQPVVYANEIGQAVERAVSLLAVVFCADTYGRDKDTGCTYQQYPEKDKSSNAGGIY